MKLNFQLGPLNIQLGKADISPPKKRGYTAARIDRLSADWLSPQTSSDAELAAALPTLRGRSRELERNNEYAQGYFGLLENNVLGANGVALEMKVSDPSGTTDGLANNAIKAAWKEWSGREYCTMSGESCWREVEGLALRSTARDGGVIVREIKGAPSKFGYAIDVIEIDLLDINYNMALPNGGDIRFGIERNQWKRPVAFHLLAYHPGDNHIPMVGRQRIRVPAEEIIHLFWRERASQSIGAPWTACVMQAIEMLGKYSEAELVAAREAACKGFAIEQTTPEGYDGEQDSIGNPVQETSPGMGLILPPGQKYIPIDPTHPNSAFGDFVKSKLRGVSAGLRVNYNSLANDLESVNYSSMRAGKLEETEEYMGVQNWLIEALHSRVFKSWLEMALIHGAIKMPNGSALPLAKMAKFHAPNWKPRRWPWVDPKKDIEAAILAVNNGYKSRRQVIAEMGGDIETVDSEQAQDDALAEANGLEYPKDKPPPPEPLVPPDDLNSKA